MVQIENSRLSLMTEDDFGVDEDVLNQNCRRLFSKQFDLICFPLENSANVKLFFYKVHGQRAHLTDALLGAV